MNNVRVIVWGLGAMGSGMAKMLLSKKGFEIAGVLVNRSHKIGKDLGELLDINNKIGVVVSNNVNEVLQISADVVLLSTTSFTKDVFPQIQQIIESGKNVVTIAEEMAYPICSEPELAQKIDELAKRHNVTVLGTGISGFIVKFIPGTPSIWI